MDVTLLKWSRKQRAWLAAIGAVCLLVPAWAQAPAPHYNSTVPAALPSLGDGSEMTLTAERKIGDRIAR